MEQAESALMPLLVLVLVLVLAQNLPRRRHY